MAPPAARLVADHLVLKPRGFAFAPHPVVADTDRDKYCVRRVIDFYGEDVLPRLRLRQGDEAS